MSNKKNIASILMLGATTIGLSNSMSTSAGLFDFLNWKEAKERDAEKNEQGYKTAKKVAKIFLEKFNNEESANENKEKKNVIAILEDLVLEKFNKEELEDYYKKKFESMTQKLKLNLNKNNIADILDNDIDIANVKGLMKYENSENVEGSESKKIDLKEKEDSNKKKNSTKNTKINANAGSVVKDNFKKKEKYSFFGCLGKAIGSIKNTFASKENTFDLELYDILDSDSENKIKVDVAITYTKISNLTKYMSELEKKLLEKGNLKEEKLLKKDASEEKEKILSLRIDLVEILIEKAKFKGVSYEKIIDAFFGKKGLLLYLKNLFFENPFFKNPFSNDPLTETLWKKRSQNSEKIGNAEVVELNDKDKAILHELGYERNNSGFRSGVRLGVSIALTSAVVAGLSAASPLIAGVAAAPIGVALTGFVATIVDRVAFKTRFKEYRDIKSWHPRNWEVQRFLKDTVKNTITSALWALSIGQVLPSFF